MCRFLFTKIALILHKGELCSALPFSGRYKEYYVILGGIVTYEVCIFSAKNGAISNLALCQIATKGGIVKYEVCRFRKWKLIEILLCKVGIFSQALNYQGFRYYDWIVKFVDLLSTCRCIV